MPDVTGSATAESASDPELPQMVVRVLRHQAAPGRAAEMAEDRMLEPVEVERLERKLLDQIVKASALGFEVHGLRRDRLRDRLRTALGKRQHERHGPEDRQRQRWLDLLGSNLPEADRHRS